MPSTLRAQFRSRDAHARRGALSGSPSITAESARLNQSPWARRANLVEASRVSAAKPTRAREAANDGRQKPNDWRGRPIVASTSPAWCRSSKTPVPTGTRCWRRRTLAGVPKTKSVPKRCTRKRLACVTIRSFGGGVKRQRLVKGVVVGTALGCLG
jgi:hypothetical protein